MGKIKLIVPQLRSDRWYVSLDWSRLGFMLFEDKAGHRTGRVGLAKGDFVLTPICIVQFNVSTQSSIREEGDVAMSYV